MDSKTTVDSRKQSLYFPSGILEEIKQEAIRQDRSLSWIMQQAWNVARDQITSFPAPPVINKVA